MQLASVISGPVAVISDSNVGPLYGKSIAAELEGQLFTFPAGEANKSRETKAQLEDSLFAAGFGRDCTIIAVGGGVVTDIAGFVAATFCRGVKLALVPTSLLAMADASIGGKTGVNAPAGKNLIGATYQPNHLIVDPIYLATLPDDEMRNGVVEMIKHGLIADAGHLQWLVDHANTILARDSDTLEQALKTTRAIKQSVVDQDERESGLRRILNFGHTVGHAIEQVFSYQIPHGRAVAIGMIVEGIISTTKAQLATSDPIITAIQAFGIDTSLPTKPPVDDLWAAMCVDKKSSNGQPRSSLLDAIGTAAPFDGAYCTLINKKEFEQAWKVFECGVNETTTL